jgi:hypothetical protein
MTLHMSDDANQRRHPRIQTRIPARVELPGGSLPGTIENIGRGGAFVATDTLEEAIEVGASVVIVFVAPESGDERKVSGSVLRVEKYFHDGGLYRALAVKFDEPYDG